MPVDNASVPPLLHVYRWILALNSGYIDRASIQSTHHDAAQTWLERGRGVYYTRHKGVSHGLARWCVAVTWSSGCFVTR